MNRAFDISRRRLLLSLPAVVMAPRAFVQTANPPIRARGINHVTLDVSDVIEIGVRPFVVGRHAPSRALDTAA